MSKVSDGPSEPSWGQKHILGIVLNAIRDDFLMSHVRSKGLLIGEVRS